MMCPRCQTENPAHAKFCRECASSMEGASSATESYAALKAKVERLTGALSEALEQQTATAAILRVISSSPTDVQPVFEEVVERALRLLGGLTAAVVLVRDGVCHLGAFTALDEAADAAMRNVYPRSLSERPLTEGIVRDGKARLIEDAQSDERINQPARDTARARGYRSLIMVPLIQDGVVVGTINVSHRETGAFGPRHIALLQTFADQAVIAIENVRLFTELESRNRDLTTALDQQTATSEILRAISSSPADVDPVFDAIVENAGRLCDAVYCVVYRFDGVLVHVAAHRNMNAAILAELQRHYPRALDGMTVVGRSILDRQPFQVEDARGPQAPPMSVVFAERLGYRTLLSVPMLREGLPTGAIALARREARLFTETELELVKTFADQAVIAIENVRLFTELEARNRDLTETLEQQTATSEILRVISQSQTDVQPVFDTIVRSAVRLCGGMIAGVSVVRDGMLHHPANYGGSPEALAAIRRRFPRPVDMSSSAGVSILTRSVYEVSDVEHPSVLEFTREAGRILGSRSFISVPMLREGEAIGAITVTRREPGRFSEGERALLQTFADQAVIAIENARLLTELQAKTGELTESVEKLTALGEVGRAVSSTLNLETVLTTIVSRAVELSGLDGGVVSEYEDATEEFVQRAVAETAGDLARALRGVRYRKGEGAIGQTAITREPVQVPDIRLPGVYESRVREILIDSGVRAVLAVPMIHQQRLIGCLGVTRNRPGEFPTETIELLRTFATQSALAIQNARLFREIEEKGRELAAASQHKSEFLANMSHELRTPLNAIIGFSEVLSERMFGELNEKQDEYLKDIYSSGQHLLSLINDILDLSKIEAGRMELEVTDFDLPAAIDNALILVRERASRRGIALRRTIDDEMGTVRGDERKVKQVLLNLLSNALKFTPEGGRIDVHAGIKEGMAEISVADTGVGIAPEDQEAIFEEFRQVGTADKKVEGTGLGLALSRKFIELHGGRIWVESQPGKGSTFSFTLPA